MRLVYLLLSPTFGMHQYTGDLIQQMYLNHEVHLVTTSAFPPDRYPPTTQIHTPVQLTNSGLSAQSLQWSVLHRLGEQIRQLQPEVVHFTGPHLWNIWLAHQLRQWGVPVVHTLHDLDPHAGARGGRLLYLWNGAIKRLATKILVHGQGYWQRLIQEGVPAHRLAYLPLLHLCFSHETMQALLETPLEVAYDPFALFFGRVESYKGADLLLAAYGQLPESTRERWKLILAGTGHQNYTIPTGAIWHNRHIDDAEAIDLFRRCTVVILPYRSASQSALISVAYFFRKPVIVTSAGALPEYVAEKTTGWIIPAGDVPALARVLHHSFSHSDQLPQLGENGYQWYQEQQQHKPQQLLQIYESARA